MYTAALHSINQHEELINHNSCSYTIETERFASTIDSDRGPRDSILPDKFHQVGTNHWMRPLAVWGATVHNTQMDSTLSRIRDSVGVLLSSCVFVRVCQSVRLSVTTNHLTESVNEATRIPAGKRWFSLINIRAIK
jgi:hypothetical protein